MAIDQEYLGEHGRCRNKGRPSVRVRSSATLSGSNIPLPLAETPPNRPADLAPKERKRRIRNQRRTRKEETTKHKAPTANNKPPITRLNNSKTESGAKKRQTKAEKKPDGWRSAREMRAERAFRHRVLSINSEAVADHTYAAFEPKKLKEERHMFDTLLTSRERRTPAAQTWSRALNTALRNASVRGNRKPQPEKPTPNKSNRTTNRDARSVAKQAAGPATGRDGRPPKYVGQIVGGGIPSLGRSSH